MMLKIVTNWLVSMAMASLVWAAENQTAEYPIDPYLQYRPAFPRSLPVQILLTGIVLTLVAVLFIHLMFTAQYHWPLAPVNYVLQLSGVTTLLISLIATIHVVLSAALAESEEWPYMLSYIAVNVPPPLDTDTDTDVWSMAERATWLVMNASTSGLIQITHIQFLTLLYPSRLEGRLIFTLLGPLAIVAAVMQLVPISSNVPVNAAASAVRNVCNATLSLLFTVALFIWGLLVNRKQAWRTDGGTAAFGAAALTLALVSTALNFLYVHKEDEFVWLPGLMWAVVLWQSFLGWWWWVGAGSGGGLASREDLEDKLEREAKRESRKRQARERRRETKDKAKKVWMGVTGAFSPAERCNSTGTHSHAASEENHSHVRPRRATHGHRPSAEDELRGGHPSPTPSLAPSMTSTLSATSVVSYSTLPRGLPRFMHQWYASLRREHVAAARQQAAERVQRIRELERNGTKRAPRFGSGWGLGSFGWRIGPVSPPPARRFRHRRDGEEDFEEEGRCKRVGCRSLSLPRFNDRRARSRNDVSMDVELDQMGEDRGIEGNLDESLSSSSSRGDHHEEADDGRSMSREAVRVGTVPADYTSHADRRQREAPPIANSPSPPSRTGPTAGTRTAASRSAPSTPGRSNSIWWWGPLGRWRLQDSTSYS